MKIAMFSWESLYTIQVGGLGVAATRLAERLAERGHHVSFFTRGAPGQPEHMVINGVHYHTLDVQPAPSSYSLAFGMSDLMIDRLHSVERMWGEFDIIHGHDWLVVDALQRMKSEGRKVMMTYHSTEYGRNGGIMGDWPSFHQISDRERYAAQIADRVTTISEHMRRELNWLYDIPLDKIGMVPNGIDPERYRVDVDAGRVKESLGIHPLAPLVLFAGRLEYQKGPDLLVEAIPKVLETRADVKFAFLGRGGMRGELEAMARRLSVGDATLMLGFLPFWEYLEKINSCDIVCIPSRNEPFGLVLLEAWSAGRPVLASRVGGLNENIESGVNGLLTAPNPSDISRSISYLLGSPGVLKRLGEAGTEKAKEFGWDRAVTELLENYEIALGS